jgi:hypothetical protein
MFLPEQIFINDFFLFSAAIINASRQSRLRWESLQRTITRAARSKQAVLELERELERLLNDREMICRDLASVSLSLNQLTLEILITLPFFR